MPLCLLPARERQTIRRAFTVVEGLDTSQLKTSIRMYRVAMEGYDSPSCCTDTTRAIADSMTGSNPDPVTDNKYPRDTLGEWQYFTSG